jgi:hypothetical protein
MYNAVERSHPSQICWPACQFRDLLPSLSFNASLLFFFTSLSLHLGQVLWWSLKGGRTGSVTCLTLGGAPSCRTSPSLAMRCSSA